MMSNEEFFKHVNIYSTGLEDARECVEQGDYGKAFFHYREYLKKRFAELPKAPAHHGSPNADEVKRQADLLLENKLSLLGYEPVELPVPVNWLYYPFGDNQWQSHLCYLEWTRNLIDAYQNTGDVRYLDKWCRFIEDFIDHHPWGAKGLEYHTSRPMYLAEYKYKCGGEGQMPGYLVGSWIGLAASIRTSVLLAELQALIGEEALSDRLLKKIIISLATDHVDVMINNARRYTPNQLFDGATALLRFSICFCELRAAPAAYLVGMDRMEEAFRRNILPDGADIEQSFNYNSFMPFWFNEVYCLYGKGPMPRIEKLKERAVKRCEFLTAMMEFDNTWPAVAKAYSEDVTGLVAEYERLYGIKLLGEFDKTTFFPYGGYYVFKNRQDQRYLLFKASRKAIGHAHEDCNSVVLSAFGEKILVDAGNYNYSNDEQSLIRNQYFVSTSAHNSLSVDGYSQNRIPFAENDPRVLEKIGETPLEGCGYGGGAEYAKGEYSNDYGDALLGVIKGMPVERFETNHIHVRHEREVIHLKEPGAFVLIDTVKDSENKAHTYTLSWNFNYTYLPESISFGENSICAEQEGLPGLFIQTVAEKPMKYRMTCGENEPFSGWMATGYGKLKKCVHIEQDIKGSCEERFYTLVYPYRDNGLQAFAKEGEHIKIRMASGAAFILHKSNGEWQVKKAEGEAGQGE